MKYTVDSEYCTFGRDMMTDSWLSYMYRLTGLTKYASRKSYNEYLKALLVSSRPYAEQSCLIAA